ncbi:hypothetical protein J8273_5268 [Carpediemonas membranifera]|uniref:Uncharacterized protein n=1 Tax=Carpediemonas membranifera TaxID=201153 RepID=A0A8J6B3M4_9EUKA|nr:hypothetical protein J8273_5268 [Carpediemonas membranifera]|eukprot:KAG9392279.1 hypothetical protein J8273_5268 [Carpediemonas membranifera]
MPSIHNNKSTSTPTSVASLESLIATLSKLPPLKPSAQALLDRARSILTSGPPTVHERRARGWRGAPGCPAHAEPGRGVGVSGGWRGQPRPRGQGCWRRLKRGFHTIPRCTTRSARLSPPRPSASGSSAASSSSR